MIHPVYETSREPTRRRLEDNDIDSDEVWMVELISGLINWRRYVVLLPRGKWCVLTVGQAANLPLRRARYRMASASDYLRRRYKSRGEALDAAEAELRAGEAARRLTGSRDQR